GGACAGVLGASRGLGADRAGWVLVLEKAIHEKAALEVVPPEPLIEDVEDRQQLLLGPRRSPFHLPLEPLPRPDPLAALEHREDELVLRPEVPVEGHLRHAGLGDDSIDADGANAVAGEEVVRRLKN